MSKQIPFMLLLCMAGPALGNACDEILALDIDTVSIISAAEVPAGDYEIPESALKVKLAAHCRVNVILAPSSDSHIEMALWMPSTNWNGKFLALGNGGWAGSISYDAMASGLQQGYAVASNDTGHKQYTAAFAVGHGVGEAVGDCRAGRHAVGVVGHVGVRAIGVEGQGAVNEIGEPAIGVGTTGIAYQSAVPHVQSLAAKVQTW